MTQTGKATMNGNGSLAPANGLATSGPPRERSQALADFDNLVRRRLRVSDPNDPAEIAGALGRVYPQEVSKLDRESQGLPFAFTVYTGGKSAQSYVGTDGEDALANVEHDLAALSASSLLREVKPELRGWSAGIRSAIVSGLNAARSGIDPQQRERVFAARRTLGDYARLLRFAGALSPAAQSLYRKAARAIDSAASVILVSLGQAMAQVGLVGSRFLMQAPAVDLQTRRDAVLAALRNLVGSGESAAPDGWPRGILALRQLSVYLQDQGYADLEPLLQDSYLAAQLDELVHASEGEGAEGLRTMSAGAEPILNGLRRLVLVCRGTAQPASPTLEAFRVALQHFLDPFDPGAVSSGYRLPFMSRPPLLLSNMAGGLMPDWGSQRLVDLAALRFRIADDVEHYHQFDVGDDLRIGEQVLLDACLQCFDKAVDLYSLGTDPVGDGPAEWRAASYGYIAHAVRFALPGDARGILAANALYTMGNALVYWSPAPPPPPANVAPLGAPVPDEANIIGEELALEEAAEGRWFDLARSVAPDFILWARGADSPLIPFIEDARVMAGAPAVAGGFDVPRDVPTLLEDVF